MSGSRSLNGRPKATSTAKLAPTDGVRYANSG